MNFSSYVYIGRSDHLTVYITGIGFGKRTIWHQYTTRQSLTSV